MLASSVIKLRQPARYRSMQEMSMVSSLSSLLPGQFGSIGSDRRYVHAVMRIARLNVIEYTTYSAAYDHV